MSHIHAQLEACPLGVPPSSLPRSPARILAWCFVPIISPLPLLCRSVHPRPFGWIAGGSFLLRAPLGDFAAEWESLCVWFFKRLGSCAIVVMCPLRTSTSPLVPQIIGLPSHTHTPPAYSSPLSLSLQSRAFLVLSNRAATAVGSVPRGESICHSAHCPVLFPRFSPPPHALPTFSPCRRLGQHRAQFPAPTAAYKPGCRARRRPGAG